MVERMGCNGGAFRMPDMVLGKPHVPLHSYTGEPTLRQLDAAGARPLLILRGSETCGFHFVGDSSLGKSTLLKVAASVYGAPAHYPRTWRATDNALEATAAAHSDCLLLLDEVGQMEPRIVGET